MEKVSLEKLCRINYGKSPAEVISIEGEIEIVGTGGERRVANKFLYNGETIVLGRKGTIDKPTYQNGKIWVIDTAFFLSDFIDVDVKYLFYYLSNINLKNLNESTGVPSIARDVLYKIQINLPTSKSEQIKIAAVITTTDEAISHTEILIAKYQRIKTGLMQDLLIYGIDRGGVIRRNSTHRIIVKNGIPIPEDWEIVLLESICQKIADRDHTTPKYVDDGVPIISPKDFNELHEIDFSKCLRITKEAHLLNSKKTNIEKGDLIFTRIGAGLGKICKVTPDMPDFSILHSACMIKPNAKSVTSDYLLYFMKSFFAQRQIADGVQSIGVPDLGMDKIRTFLVKKPKSIQEQNRITDVLKSQDDLIKKEKENLKKLHLKKAGLMQDLLSGKVRVK